MTAALANAAPDAGPLADLLSDPQVTDVFVNGTQVWVDRGGGAQRCAVRLGGPDEVRRLAQRLAATAGRRLDDGCPYVDVRMPDGTRLHAVLPPVARTGPYLSLRTMRVRAFTLAELVSTGTLDAGAAALLAAVVAARLAYVVTGGTGAGKTTLLAALPRDALHAQVAAALRVVVQVRRTGSGRVVDEVCLLLPGTGRGLLTAVPAWRRGTGPGPAAGALARLFTERGVAVPAVLGGAR